MSSLSESLEAEYRNVTSDTPTFAYRHFPDPGVPLPPVERIPAGPRGRMYDPSPRPAVRVKLVGPNGRDVVEWGVVDSGADVTAFPLRLMEPLGVPTELCDIGRPGRAGEHVVMPLRYTPGIEAEVAGRWRARLAGWFPQVEWPYILLGREDFFAHFDVTFRQRAGEFTLRAHADVERVPDPFASTGASVAARRLEA